MSNLIGLGLSILGVVTAALFPNAVSFVVMFVGVFLFVSFPDQEVFCDYVIANSEDVLARKRYYFRILLFEIGIAILTLGLLHVVPRVMWKEEYFKISANKETQEMTKLSRKEYIALRNEQRRIYSMGLLSKEFMEKSYSRESIGFKRKKRRCIIATVLACLMLTCLSEPGGIYIVLIYEAILIPMIILWGPDYKDAKILQQAYDRAMNEK